MQLAAGQATSASEAQPRALVGAHDIGSVLARKRSATSSLIRAKPHTHASRASSFAIVKQTSILTGYMRNNGRTIRVLTATVAPVCSTAETPLIDIPRMSRLSRLHLDGLDEKF
jgi:hypothetical protein